MLFLRGDIVLVDFDPGRRHEAAKQRPAVVVTNDMANASSPVVMVVPLTSNVARIYPHETLLPVNRCGLEFDSKAQVHLLRYVSTERILRTVGRVPDDLMLALDNRLREHLAL